MAKHIVWASEADENDVLAPSADKQRKGWVEEVPPHEWFNWHMRRNDQRLNDLEKPLSYVILDLPATERTETIKKGTRFNLPASYVVGAGQLHVYLDGLLCHEGTDQQYVECGQQYAESNYIRWNDNIAPEFDIRIEIPLLSKEPSIYADETLVGNVAALAERVGKLEEPIYSTRLDSPANTRSSVIRAGEIFTFDAEYTVGADQLQVFKNGILLYAGTDYIEVGTTGEKASDISFTADVEISDSIRAYIAIRGSEEYIVLAGSSSLKTLEDKVRQLTRQTRVDDIVKARIEALADYTVPEYAPGTNTLKIYKNGVLLVPNRDYSENSDEGETSTRIIWNASVDTGTLITVITPATLEKTVAE